MRIHRFLLCLVLAVTLLAASACENSNSSPVGTEDTIADVASPADVVGEPDLLGDPDVSIVTEDAWQPPADLYNPPDEDNLIGGWDLLIVTTEPMRTAFEELADWRRQTGLPTHIATMDDVLADGETPDRATVLRSFIKNAFDEHGTRIVLLGGDAPDVPHRTVFAAMKMGSGDLGYEHDCEAPTELYFSDLDGDWDGDGDGDYAEFEDDLDMVPDVAVGRVPAYGNAVAQRYIDKVIAYEMGETDDYQQRILFLSEDTGFGGIDSALMLNTWDGYTFDDRYDIEKLYHKSAGYPDAQPNTTGDEIAAIHEGKGMIVHLGHGSTGMLAYLDREEVNDLNNGSKTSVFFSCACYSGDFSGESRQSAGELYVTNPNGGGVAYIGNTDVGIGFPPGALFLQAMLDEILNAVDVPRLGEAFATARSTFTPGAGGTWTELHEDRYTQLVVILLGDPALRTWRVRPRRAQVDVTAEVPVDGPVAVSVKTASGTAVEGATVTVYQKNRVLRITATDEGGGAEFATLDAVPGPVLVTVSGLDLKPVVAEIIAR